VSCALAPAIAPALLLAGCELFQGREVEAPELDGEGDWLPPLSPASVVHNLREAVRTLDSGNYIAALSDSGWAAPFRFLPDQQYQGHEVMEDWDADDEAIYWQNVVEHMGALQYAEEPRLDIDTLNAQLYGDRASLAASYYLFLDHGREGLPDEFAGTLRFTLTRHLETGDWAISRWEDASDSTGSWTRLKVEFY